MPYKWMQTLWTKFAVSKNVKLSLIGANIGFQNAQNNLDSAKVYFQQTVGANFTLSQKKTSAGISAYYQMGKTALNQTTAAYLLSANLNQNITDKFNLGIGYDFLSGNKVGQPNDKFTAFIPYFGTNHKFYGFMDYYYVGNSHKNAGLSDIYLKGAYKGSEKFILNFAIHQFNAGNKVFNGADEMNKNLGQELDLGFNYKINKFAGFMGGYSFYLPTKTTAFLKSTTNEKSLQQWVWLGLNITPKFLDIYF